jgi:hypothetical protein
MKSSSSQRLDVWVDVEFDRNDDAHIYLNDVEITDMLPGDVLSDLEQRAEADALEAEEEMRIIQRGGGENGEL